jgi:hypothetical protein
MKKADLNRPGDIVARHGLGVDIMVSGACLGTTTEITVGGVNGQLKMPVVRWVDARPFIEPPAYNGIGESHFKTRCTPSLNRWGSPLSWTKDSSILKTYVTDVLMVFPSVNLKSAKRGSAIELIRNGIDAWTDLLRRWVAVLSEQVTDPKSPLDRISITARGFDWVAVQDDSEVVRPTDTRHLTITVDTHTIPLSKEQWLKVCELSNQSKEPPITYQLLSDARTACLRGETRRAVIDAGMATELSLAQILRSALSSLPPQLAEAIASERRTLGPLVSLVGQHRPLPLSIKKKLVELRNQAIHRNEAPSRAQAAEAISLARSVVLLSHPDPTC